MVQTSEPPIQDHLRWLRPVSSHCWNYTLYIPPKITEIHQTPCQEWDVPWQLFQHDPWPQQSVWLSQFTTHYLNTDVIIVVLNTLFTMKFLILWEGRGTLCGSTSFWKFICDWSRACIYMYPILLIIAIHFPEILSLCTNTNVWNKIKIRCVIKVWDVIKYVSLFHTVLIWVTSPSIMWMGVGRVVCSQWLLDLCWNRLQHQYDHEDECG